MDVQAILKGSRERRKFKNSMTHGFTDKAREENYLDFIESSLPREFWDGHSWSAPLEEREINILKNSTRIFLSLDTKQNIYSFSVTNEGKEVDLAVPARVYASYASHKGFEILYTQPGSLVWSILQCLQKGDCLRVLWWADTGSNQFAKDAHISVDCVYLEVRRGDILLKFCISQKTMPTDCSIRTLRPR